MLPCRRTTWTLSPERPNAGSACPSPSRSVVRGGGGGGGGGAQSDGLGYQPGDGLEYRNPPFLLDASAATGFISFFLCVYLLTTGELGDPIIEAQYHAAVRWA